MYNGKSSHIGLRHSYVNQLIKEGVINVTYVQPSESLADHLTKVLWFSQVYGLSL